MKTIIINGLRLHADVGESYFRSDYGDLVTTIHAYVDRGETRVSITVMTGRLSITSRGVSTDADLAFVSALTDLIQASSPAIAEALAHAVIRTQIADGQIAQVAA